MKKRNTKFYKNEPNVAEIEHRLKNILAYIDEGNADKAKGGVKGVWHTLIQITENLQDLIEAVDYDLSTLSRITYNDDENWERRRCINEIDNNVDKMRPYLETNERHHHKEKFSDCELRKAWKLMYEHLCKIVIKDFGWEGCTDDEIKKNLNGWFVWIKDTPIKGTRVLINYYKEKELCIPIFLREQRDELAPYKEEMGKFFTNYFDTPIKVVEEIYNY